MPNTYKLSAVILCFIILGGCSAPYQKYSCDNGAKIQAQFETSQVKWSLRRSGMIMDMTALPKVNNTLYQKNTAKIEKLENNDIYVDATIIEPHKINTVCHLDLE